MMVRIFRSGTSCGKSPVEYIMGNTDHSGEKRSVKPEILSGDNDHEETRLSGSFARK